MYLKRKADDYLDKWMKDPNRFPLVVSGARQVGKTETIRQFAKSHYENVIEINFVTHPQYKAITENGYAPCEIIKVISRINPSLQFLPGKTLLFFDEIQDFPDIATSLKFFKEDGGFDVICSGSLLGIQYKHISSISVGYKADYKMYSMDFEEFLWAKGYGNKYCDELLPNMLQGIALSSSAYAVYSALFLEYCILGGMPRVIKESIEKGTYGGSLELQRQLVSDYESDIRKYAEGLDQTKIVSVYRSIPAQLAKENKKFQYTRVSKGGRSKEYMGCVQWLDDAGLINICHCLGFPELPLKGNIDEDKYKVYFADTGLLVAALDDEAQIDLRANKNMGVYKGALYENFIAEALMKQNFGLYYYKRENSTLEEDFFIRSANELIPVEVKANNNTAKSLRQLIKSDSYPDIRHGIKFASANIGISDSVITFPYFCIYLLRRFMNEQNYFN